MEKNTDAVREFVKNPPHDAQFHNLYEADYTLQKWRCEFGDRIPAWMNAVILFCGQVLSRLGARFRDVDPLDAWIEQSNTYTTRCQFITGDGTHWEILVEPDGLYSRHLLEDVARWSDWTRETR